MKSLRSPLPALVLRSLGVGGSLLLSACFLLLIFFASYRLTESPPLWYDEGIYDQIAMNVSLHGTQQIQLAPNTFMSSAFVTGGYPFLFPIAVSFKLFGIGILQSRAVMAFFIVFLGLFSFLLMRRLTGEKMATISLLLFATFPLLYGNGKTVLGEVPGLFYLTLFLIFLQRFESKHGSTALNVALMGLFGGLCIATKPIFMLLGLAVLVALIVRRKEVLALFAKKSAVLWLGIVTFIAPVGLWLYFQFARNDSAGHVLGYYANPYGFTDIGSIITQNLLRFVHESTPIYFALLLIAWIAAVLIRVRVKQKITLTEIVTFTFAILVTIAYVRTAGWYRYLFVGMVPALLFLPHNIDIIRQKMAQHWQRPKLFSFVAGCGIALLLAVHLYQMLFASFVAENYKATVSHDLQEYFARQDAKESYFIYNVPELAMLMPNQTYYQYLAPTESLQFGTSSLGLLDRGIPDVLLTSTHYWNNGDNPWKAYTKITAISSYVIARPTARLLRK